MKKTILLLSLMLVPTLFMTGCKSNVDNKLTFRNFASNTVYVNFRASLITVPAGESVQITEMPKGTYTYETTYEVPEGTVEAIATDKLSGVIELAAGTKILIVYSSTFNEGVYTISATITSSDDQSDPVSP